MRCKSAELASRFKSRNRVLERGGKILIDHGQDGNVAVGGIGNLARSDSSVVSEIQQKHYINVF